MNYFFKYGIHQVQWLFMLIYGVAAVVVIIGLLYFLWLKFYK